MSRSKLIRLALLFVPLALLSACGRMPAYGDGTSPSLATPLYSYSQPKKGWDFMPDGGTHDGSGSDSESAEDGTPVTGPKVSNFCQIHDCVAISRLTPIKPWKYHIPVVPPIGHPDPHTQVIYEDKVYEVVGYGSQAQGAPLMVRQVGELVAR